MRQAYLEHTNTTVTNPDQTAQRLCELFDWTVRWSGESMDQGYTVHVGGESSYLALYTNPQVATENATNHTHLRNLNHVAVVVNSLEEVQKRAEAIGLTPFNFREYNPGKSFYLRDDDGLEIEVVNYD